MIHKLGDADFETVFAVINQAAIAFKGQIPPDCWKEPYMPKRELQAEIQSGVQFYGYLQDNRVIAVMGIQRVKDVTLLRHAYTLTDCQHQGIGKKLLDHLLGLAQTSRILVGTWTDATWAVRFYRNQGFKITTRQQTNSLLHKYWDITERQVETSVVLETDRREP